MGFCKAANNLLYKYIQENKIDIVIWQDAYRRGSSYVGLDCSITNYTTSIGRAGIIVANKDLITNMILQKENSVFINIMTELGNITLGSQYSSPSDDLESDLNDWGDVDFITERFIVAGDLNGKNRLWGYGRNDLRGETIIDFITANNLVICNKQGQPSTYFSAGKTGNPDLTITTNSFKDHIQNWHVDTEDSASDHRYIRYAIGKTKPTLNKRKRYRTKFGNTDKFKKLAVEHLTEYVEKLEYTTTIPQLDKNLEDIFKIIHNISGKIFRFGGGKNAKPTTWWNGSLREVKHKLKALYKCTVRDKENLDIKISYRKARAEYKQLINAEKLKAWKNYCSASKEKFGNIFGVIKNKSM